MSEEFFEAVLLPDGEKERLCRALLAEFGVTSIRTRRGELIHSCSLPWHDDSHPSASLNYLELVYNCFGCQSSGGLLWYIGSCRGTSGTEARKWLESETGTGAEEQSLPSLLRFFDEVYSPSRSERPPMPKMGERVLDPWLAIHPYLTEVRGISEKTLMDFRVGWNPVTNRIVVPHFWRGDLVGWQTRRLTKDGTPKYQSSPDFPKDTTIFNYQPRLDPVVVESPMSVLSKAHLGPIEATFGASLTDSQIRLLADHRRATLFFDNDEAGWRATEHLGEALTEYGMPVFAVDNPWSADPADMDDDTYLRLIEGAVPFSVWRRPEHVEAWEEVSDADHEVRRGADPARA